jgi:hypothetical protein
MIIRFDQYVGKRGLGAGFTDWKGGRSGQVVVRDSQELSGVFVDRGANAVRHVTLVEKVAGPISS